MEKCVLIFGLGLFMMFLIKMRLSILDTTDELTKTINLLDDSVQEIRTVSHNLVPPGIKSKLIDYFRYTTYNDLPIP